MADLLSALNPAQKDAVTTTTGPLLIIAGAGTGKTKVLTHRIAHLIESGSFKPEEILALTFTDKATNEMQERLDVLLPYSYGELWVKTFHGFCDAVLRESGLELGIDTDYKLLTQTDLWLFLREKLYTFELDYYRPLGNPTRFVVAMAQHFGHLRDELVTPEKYLAHAEESLKCAEDDADVEAAEKMLELAKAYAHYNQLLIKEAVLDFASLHALTLKLFNEHPSVLANYRKRFKSVLVDEFQDTNTAQNHLVELLASDHQNIMVVGDDDQSIYKWRGASLANILEFESKFPECKKVVLTENYRSTQPILDMSYAVIQHNNPFRLEAREDLDKKLRSSAGDGVQPKVIHFDHYLQEVQYVVDEIQRQVKSGSEYKDCAVLVRATAHAIPFIDEMTRAGIPVTFSGAQGLYHREEIKDVMCVLRSLVNPYDDIALFRFLSMPVFKLEQGYLLRLVGKAKRLSAPLSEVIRKEEDAPDLFSGIGSGTGLGLFIEQFEALREMAKDHPTSHVIGKFLKDVGYLSELETDQTAEKAEKLQNIASFSKIIRSFEELNAHDQSVLSCLAYIQARQDVGDRPSPPEELMDNNTVKVLTVHASKGLEFEHVFMVDLVQNRFPSINRRDPIAVPPELLTTVIEDPNAHRSEERRLFYVAATRAKANLYMTYSDYYAGRRRWKPSQFVNEAIESGFAELIEKPLSEKEDDKMVVATQDEGDKPLVFGLDRQHRSLRLSFSRINTFETCPLKYKFRYLYSLPEPLSHAASFGSSVHNALNSFYQRLKDGHDVSLELLRELYDKHWIPLGYDGRAHQNARKKKGWEILEQFFESNSAPWVIPKALEKPFTLKTEKGLVISGRIDRIDNRSDGTVAVIDYKTGRLKDQKYVDQDLQLSIYALACEEIYKYKVSELSLYYLESDEIITTHRSPEQLKQTKEDLDSIAQTIQSSNFGATPSPHICGYCDYKLLCDKAMA
jgi:DNA helicase-2/ATP-dependent DNA helicase PcrA